MDDAAKGLKRAHSLSEELTWFAHCGQPESEKPSCFRSTEVALSGLSACLRVSSASGCSCGGVCWFLLKRHSLSFSKAAKGDLSALRVHTRNTRWRPVPASLTRKPGNLAFDPLLDSHIRWKERWFIVRQPTGLLESRRVLTRGLKCFCRGRCSEHRTPSYCKTAGRAE